VTQYLDILLGEISEAERSYLALCKTIPVSRRAVVAQRWLSEQRMF